MKHLIQAMCLELARRKLFPSLWGIFVICCSSLKLAFSLQPFKALKGEIIQVAQWEASHGCMWDQRSVGKAPQLGL